MNGIDTITRLKGGTLGAEIEEAMRDLTHAVTTNNKAGDITIKIKMRPATASTVALTGEITRKFPKDAPVESLLFPTPEGNLLVDNPAQHKLPLRVAGEGEQPAGELKQASGT